MRYSLSGFTNRSIQIDQRIVARVVIVVGILFLSAYVIPRLSNSRLWLTLSIVPAVALVAFLLKRPQWGILALIPVALIVPFTISTGTQTRVHLAMLMIPLLAGLWVFDGMIRRRLALPHLQPVLPLLALAIVSALALINGQLPWFSVQGAPLASQLGGLSIFLLSVALTLLVAAQVDDVRWLRWMVWLFLAIGALIVVGRSLPGSSSIIALLVPAGATGSLFWVWLTALASSQAIFNTTLRNRWRAALIALALFTLAVALVDFDWKSGWLPSLAALAVVAWLGVPRLRVWLLIIGALVAAPYSVDAVNALIADDLYSWNTRVLAWRIVLEVAEVSPFLGLGPSNYYFYTPLIPILGYRVQFNSHNQYVDLLAQTGVIGLFCFLWFAWAMGRSGWRLFHTLPAGFGRAYAAGVLGGLVGSLVAGMLGDWILPFVYNIGFTGYRSALLAWLFLGGLLVVERLAHNRSTPS